MDKQQLGSNTTANVTFNFRGNSTIPLNTTNYTFATFAPGVTLPQGKAFGIRVDFVGDTAETISLLWSPLNNKENKKNIAPKIINNNTYYYLDNDDKIINFDFNIYNEFDF